MAEAMPLPLAVIATDSALELTGLLVAGGEGPACANRRAPAAAAAAGHRAAMWAAAFLRPAAAATAVVLLAATGTFLASQGYSAGAGAGSAAGALDPGNTALDLFSLPHFHPLLPHLPWLRHAPASPQARPVAMPVPVAPTSPAPTVAVPGLPPPAQELAEPTPATGPPALAGLPAGAPGGVEAAQELLRGSTTPSAVPPPRLDTLAAQCGLPVEGATIEYEHGIRVRLVDTAAACCARCQGAHACLAWTFVWDGGLRPGVPECWLKGGIRHQTKQKDGMVSASIPGRAQPGPHSTPYLLNYQAVHTPNYFNCKATEPPLIGGASTTGPPTQLTVLTYNLFWWNLFDKGQAGELHAYRGTTGNTGTQHLAQIARDADIMAFQECMDLKWTLNRAGFEGLFRIFEGAQEICMAFREERWSLLGRGQTSVAEDKPTSYWRKRDVQWLRLEHQDTKQPVFFMNHHGPLPLNSGGVCGGRATAANLLTVASANSWPGDVVVLVGDFNAGPRSETVRSLDQVLHKAFSGYKQGGIDHVFTNLPASAVLASKILGSGGSDHDALGLTLRLGGGQ